jgi:hypothetical protein
MSDQSSLRMKTLQCFTALRSMREQWGMQCVLGIGLQGSGRPLALASLAAGAAGLFLEGDVAALRAAQREGCCTFIVSSLDEALRALKNEVRQAHAITVGLSGDPLQWLQEMLMRGVLPAVVAAESTLPVEQLVKWGAQPVHGLGLARQAATSLDLEAIMNGTTGERWTLQDDEAAASMSDRRVRDAAMMAEYGSDDPIETTMRAWLRVAPSLFPRERSRSRWIAVTKP